VSKVSKGTHPLVIEELIGVEDGTSAFRYQGIVSEYPDDLGMDETNELQWVCEPDPDDQEVIISIEPELLGRLVRSARAHCPSCEGCNRA
jgi:hypothetical protein